MSKVNLQKCPKWVWIGLIVLVAAAVVAMMLNADPEELPDETPTTAVTDPVDSTTPVEIQTEPAPAFLPELQEELNAYGLYILSVDSYAGIYVEDGSDDVVQGLMMVILENRSEKALQLCNLTLDFGDAQASFSATNIPAGGRVALLEQNRMPYRSDDPVRMTVENIAMMDAFPLYEDVFEITTLDGVINIRNISGNDIIGDIFIYYKNVGGGIYYGGITYRVRIADGLKAGEIRQLMTAHYYEDASEILMVTYAP